MSQSSRTGDTAFDIKQRIWGLKEQHITDLERADAWHAAEYLQDTRDQYRAVGHELEVKDLRKAEEGIQDVWGSVVTSNRWADEVDQMRSACVRRLWIVPGEGKGSIKIIYMSRFKLF